MNYHVAFVGNPNVGKSAWINALSNADFKVGNWPGVTVEKKEANVCWGGDSYHIIDLPGTYSLTNNGNEESITAAYLQSQQVDLIVSPWQDDAAGVHQPLHAMVHAVRYTYTAMYRFHLLPHSATDDKTPSFVPPAFELPDAPHDNVCGQRRNTPVSPFQGALKGLLYRYEYHSL